MMSDKYEIQMVLNWYLMQKEVDCWKAYKLWGFLWSLVVELTVYFYSYRFVQLVSPEDNVNVQNCLDCTIVANVLSILLVCQKAKCWYHRWELWPYLCSIFHYIKKSHILCYLFLQTFHVLLQINAFSVVYFFNLRRFFRKRFCYFLLLLL